MAGLVVQANNVSLTLGRLRQEDRELETHLRKLHAILGYTLRPYL